MNPNIINNFSPILALKTYYINKCFAAGVRASSLPSEIPSIEISRTLTTSIPGFSDQHVVSWRNAIIQGEAFVVVRMLEKDSTPTYTLYKISSAKNAPQKESTLLKALDIPDGTSVYAFPIVIPYTSSNEYYDGIASTYVYNILNSTEWVDAITPTTDNLEMVGFMKKFDLTMLKINLNTDNVYKYILINPGVLPRPNMLTYVVRNILTGKEYITKVFSDKLTTTIIKKPTKVNEDSSEE